jgi:class 3 adenylate cyclase
MAREFPYDLLNCSQELSSYQGWSEEVYQDFLAFRQGGLSEEQLRAKYCRRRAIVSLDMTGFTTTAINIGEVESLVRIFDAQRVCIPVLKDFDAELIRCFADDVVALFETPDAAVDAAFEIHHRIAHFGESSMASAYPTQCCIGIGYGSVFAIGPNLAQGDEMNRASKLGEDVARGQETLVTENVFEALQHRDDLRFERPDGDDLLFPFYRAAKI